MSTKKFVLYLYSAGDHKAKLALEGSVVVSRMSPRAFRKKRSTSRAQRSAQAGGAAGASRSS